MKIPNAKTDFSIVGRKNMKTLGTAIATLLFAGGLSMPAQNVTPPSLAQVLTKYVWSWDAGGEGATVIQFFQDGTARNQKYFNARWKQTGLHTVTLTLKHKGKEKTALLTFDPTGTRYEGTGFNEKLTIKGFRKEPVDPATHQ